MKSVDYIVRLLIMAVMLPILITGVTLLAIGGLLLLIYNDVMERL